MGEYQEGGARMSMSLLEPLLARLRLIVGRCVITATKYKGGEMLSDIGLVADEKRRNVELMQQYGFSSRPKGDVDGVAIFVGGSRENGVVIATRGECPELNPGEVMVHSPFGSGIKLKDDGSVELVTDSNTFRFVGDIETTGKMTVGGKLEADGEITAMRKSTRVSLSTHMHATAAPGNPSPPNPGS